MPQLKIQTSRCPCGNVRDYADCCGRFHAGEAADNAQKLMRSRYSAYVLGLEDYLMATWHASTRPKPLQLHKSDAPQWLGLEIRSQQQGADHARIEFIARYRLGGAGGAIQKLHEVSHFVREGDRWYYLYAEQPPPPRKNY